MNCSKCKEDKESSEFYQRTGHSSKRCKQCELLSNREYKTRNKEEIRVKNAIYREKNKSSLVEKALDWANQNRAKRRAIVSNYEARRDGQFVEPIDRGTVYIRDKGVCYLCQLPVDPENWALEHKIPLSRGGKHCYDNVGVSHHSCNHRKHTKTPEEMNCKT